MQETINKINDTQIEIINSNVAITVDIPSVKISLDQDTQALAELEVRYSEQKLNLQNLITKNQDLLDKAESVGVIIE